MIKKALKATISEYSEVILIKATDKCILARKSLIKASESDNASKYLLEALDFYIQSIEIYSRLIEPYISIAEICRQFGQLDDSISLLNRVLEIEPKNSIAINMISKIKNEKLLERKLTINNISTVTKIKKDVNSICSVKLKTPLK
jgi:tetratricopeptide (TPR) repeat protein